MKKKVIIGIGLLAITGLLVANSANNISSSQPEFALSVADAYRIYANKYGRTASKLEAENMWKKLRYDFQKSNLDWQYLK